MSDEDRFRVRPGKGRSRGGGGRRLPSLAAQVRRVAARSGAAARALRSGGGTGRAGRGRTAALRGKRAPGTRRVIVKARVVRHGGTHRRAAPLARHIAYLERDGVTRDGSPAALFDAGSDHSDGPAFAARCGDDRHHFRFIVAPEDGGAMADLRGFTRELMGDAARDLGTSLDWVAVDHWNTGNPHVHVLVRGVADDGSDLVIDRGYIAQGLRHRAEARVTLELGPRSEWEIEQSLAREVEADRWTSLDRALVARSDADGLVDLRPDRLVPPDRRALLLARRVGTLERLGLARAADAGRWVLQPDAEATLRALGERGDIIKAVHRALGGRAVPDGQLAIHPPGATDAVIGRLVERGLRDELAGTAYAIVDGIDGRHHHLRFDDLAQTGDAAPGAVVELRHWQDPRGAPRQALAVRSDLPIGEQISARGATWLDRQLLGRDPAMTARGFGGEVLAALHAREEHLIGHGLAQRRAGRAVLVPGLLDTLREAELREATAAIAARTGRTPMVARDGAAIAGTYRERVTLASGRFAMIDDGLGFQLVPWRPALDDGLGLAVTGRARASGGIDWTIGRSRGLSL